ncbi:hypothetical protein Pd630_LPD03982 [Rhodococcus opacus PD630]|nr:hypothetical protein Pd630_LPD03982 [Rhodococcus opacus PD630]
MQFDVDRGRTGPCDRRVQRHRRRERVVHVRQETLVVGAVKVHVEPDGVGQVPDHRVIPPPFAPAVPLNPAITRTRPATVDVELHGRLTRGTTVADWVGHWNREPNVDIAVSTDPVAFFDDLVDRVGRFAKSVG